MPGILRRFLRLIDRKGPLHSKGARFGEKKRPMQEM